ncbi:MAG: rod shape-determining protein RodA [Bacteroidota bacterium]|nr:rod shape-determining protein RodA [Bacteroidota bacterium]
MNTKISFKNIDFIIFFVTGFLILIGLINIYSSEFNLGNNKILEFQSNYGKQFMWLIISFLIFIIIFLIDARIIINSAYFIYAITIILLLATLVVGKEIAGSKSWLSIGSYSLQPSEFAKFGVALVLAKYLNTYNVNVSRFKDSMIAFGLILLPMILIILQNDIGSALVFVAFIFVLFRYGLSPLFLLIPFISAILFIVVLLINIYWVIAFLVLVALIIFFLSSKKVKTLVLLVAILAVTTGFLFSVDYAFNNFLQPHQQTRINVLLGKEVDLRGSGYNIHQSLIAIGSGGFSGKGFLKGTQTRFDFIPEQSTDFIFCTVAEEYGFLGSILLISLFVVLMLRIIYLSEKQKFDFIRIYGYGVISVIFIHFIVNLGMTLGIFPVIGIPLPFISYGGSSLLGFSIMISVYLKFISDYSHYYN